MRKTCVVERGCGGSLLKKDMNWRDIICHYRMCHLPNHKKEMKCFAGQSTLSVAIAKAAMAENPDGKRHDHQHRITERALKGSFRKLRSKENAIRSCKSFQELYQLIERTLKSISGTGDLYYYDTALRIGAKLDLHPKSVFLHAGTKKGASFIIDVCGKSSLERNCLPSELRRLPPDQVEDILCIYKDEIKGMHLDVLHGSRINQAAKKG